MELDIVSEIHTWGRKLNPETSTTFPCKRQITEQETLSFFWLSDLSQSSTRINFKCFFKLSAMGFAESSNEI